MSKNASLVIFLIILFLAAGILNPARATEPELWHLSSPANSEVVWQDGLMEVNGIKASATHLRTPGSSEEIFKFYQDTLTKQGWEAKDSQTRDIKVFNKKDKFMYVMATPTLKNVPSQVYLIISPKDLALCNMFKDDFMKEPIAEDASGRDLVDLARYPASKRRLNIFTPDQGALLIYEAEATPSEVAKFYRAALKGSGWQEDPTLNEETMQKMLPKLQVKDMFAILLYHRGDDAILINVASAGKELFPGQHRGSRSLVVITKNMFKEFDSSLNKKGER